MLNLQHMKGPINDVGEPLIYSSAGFLQASPDGHSFMDLDIVDLSISNPIPVHDDPVWQSSPVYLCVLPQGLGDGWNQS